MHKRTKKQHIKRQARKYGWWYLRFHLFGHGVDFRKHQLLLVELRLECRARGRDGAGGGGVLAGFVTCEHPLHRRENILDGLTALQCTLAVSSGVDLISHAPDRFG